MTLFFYGPNTYALSEQTEKMIKAYAQKNSSDMGVERIDAATSNADAIRAALQAAPFLATSRLVLISGISSAKSIFEKLSNPLDLVPETTVAVFLEAGIDQRTAAFKTLSNADMVMKFESLSSAQLSAWVVKRFSDLGIKLRPGIATELIRLIGDEQWRLSFEIEKIASYTDDVTLQVINELVIPNIEQTIFQLLEALTTGQINPTLSAYKSLLEHKKDDLYVLTMIQWQLRNLLMARTAPIEIKKEDLAKITGMSPYVASKMHQSSRNFTEEKLMTCLAIAINAEYEIKSGKTKSDIMLEQILFDITAICRR